MDRKRIVFFALCAAALVVSCVAIVLALANYSAEPVLVMEDSQARQTVEQLFEAVSRGDYEQVSACLLGSPDMGVDREAEDPVGKLIWQAYQDSLAFTAVGSSYATASGATYNYQVRHLDMDRLADELHRSSQELLVERVDQAEDVSEIYDENNEYREDFVLGVLNDAAKLVLWDESNYKTETVSVHLTYRQRRWQILPEAGLIQAITGVAVDK